MSKYYSSQYHLSVERADETIATYVYCNDVDTPLSVLAVWIAEKINEATSKNAYAHGEKVYIDLAEGETIGVTGSWERYFSDNRTYRIVKNMFSSRKVQRGVIVKPNPAVPAALWFIKQADYATSYKLYVNDVVHTITTVEADADAARAGLDTLVIASDMASLINTKTATHGCAAVQYGSTVHIYSTDGSDFTVRHTDSLGSTASNVVKTSVEDYKDLPPNAPDGFRVEITGTSSVDTDPYHVVFEDTDGTENTAGRWTETVKANEPRRINPNTMPLRMDRKQDPSYKTADNPKGIYFTLGTNTWGERVAGDKNTAPMPSFVSEMDEDTHTITTPSRIQGMFHYKNRLCFMTRENLIFSEAGEYENFFPVTVTTVLDSDAIDMYVDSNAVSPLEHAVATTNELLLFTPNSQIALRSGEIFSISTAHTIEASSYDVATSCPPVAVGNNLMFVSKGTKYSEIHEYEASQESDYSASNITEHVPNYIEGVCRKLVHSPIGNYVFLYTRDEEGNAPSHLYVYNYQWQGSKKVQSAWQKWEFSYPIVDVDVHNGVLSLLTQRSIVTDGVNGDTLEHFIEEIDLGRDYIREELGHPVYLDRRVEVPDDTDIIPEGAERHAVSWIDPEDDVRKTRYFIGYPYVQKYEFSELHPRTEGRVNTGGNTQIRNLSVNYSDTTHFKIFVERQSRDSKFHEFNGRTLGALTNLIGTIPVAEGTKRIRVQSTASKTTLRLENDSIFDAVIQNADWEGTYTNRARRT